MEHLQQRSRRCAPPYSNRFCHPPCHRSPDGTNRRLESTWPNETGGDYYEPGSPCPTESFVAGLADVTGHGIGPRPASPRSGPAPYARTNFRNQDSVFLRAMEEINSAVAADVREGPALITFVAAIFGADTAPTVELLLRPATPRCSSTRSRTIASTMMEAHGLTPRPSPTAFLLGPRRNKPGNGIWRNLPASLATDGFFSFSNGRMVPRGAIRTTRGLGQTIRAAREENQRPKLLPTCIKRVLRFAGRHKSKWDDLTAIVLQARLIQPLSA